MGTRVEYGIELILNFKALSAESTLHSILYMLLFSGSLRSPTHKKGEPGG